MTATAILLFKDIRLLNLTWLDQTEAPKTPKGLNQPLKGTLFSSND